ncbi:MAG: glycosyltransferase family 9 protein [Mariprofundus sp.]|nr:glycosyltransferase family 9 protein [Mariprofundus sp.]
MKILIVKLSAFGDIIHALPALGDLLIRPEVAEVHWLVDARYAFVTETFPAQVRVHTVALRGNSPVASCWQALRQLRRIDFDAIIDLQGLLKSAVLARGAGHPVFGIDKEHLREKASRYLMQPVCFHPDEKHVVQQYRRVAAAPFSTGSILSGKPESALPYIPPRIDIAQTTLAADTNLLARLELTDKKFVILHSAGGWETKFLPEQTWITIANDLMQTGKTPVFSWGNAAEKILAQRLTAACNGFALPERLNMSALCTLLSSACAVVGADTGLLHLAAALNTPTITFWGPSASWRSAPLNDAADPQGERNWQIESNPSCGPCFKRRCNQFVCMHAIAPESITRILHEL